MIESCVNVNSALVELFFFLTKKAHVKSQKNYLLIEVISMPKDPNHQSSIYVYRDLYQSYTKNFFSLKMGNSHQFSRSYVFKLRLILAKVDKMVPYSCHISSNNESNQVKVTCQIIIIIPDIFKYQESSI